MIKKEYDIIIVGGGTGGVCAAAVLNIIFSIILGKVWGVFGILLATSISRIIISIWYEPKILFGNVFKKKLHYIGKSK